ncbi:uncharacterized protein N7496_000515 [Penicillium cataractarum]|uniref:Glucose-methanol-choline oxidoreductase C-terminal domain-containing protein n=1 Tax=Penicillium cataractarum TaxID=2100454 RepID=A0A9W9VU63_9EURO|nr:uncharacterized protein N7496_000515 [Penicillium cataractarum]KAJ5389447.1 hypothetical protein N7496_000515 [Penicillium cataractarum]
MTLGRGPLTSNIGEAAAFLRSADYNFSKISWLADGLHFWMCYAGLGDIWGTLGFYSSWRRESTGGKQRVYYYPYQPSSPEQRRYYPSKQGPMGTTIIQLSLTPNTYPMRAIMTQNILLTGPRVCLRIVRSPALQKHLEPVPVNGDLTSAWWPYSSSNIESISDGDLISFMKEKAFTLYHPVGTVRMGSDPRTSAIDLKCRVHNVKGLGHPTAPIGAMAYKLSDMIK